MVDDLEDSTLHQSERTCLTKVTWPYLFSRYKWLFPGLTLLSITCGPAELVLIRKLGLPLLPDGPQWLHLVIFAAVGPVIFWAAYRLTVHRTLISIVNCPKCSSRIWVTWPYMELLKRGNAQCHNCKTSLTLDESESFLLPAPMKLGTGVNPAKGAFMVLVFVPAFFIFCLWLFWPTSKGTSRNTEVGNPHTWPGYDTADHSNDCLKCGAKLSSRTDPHDCEALQRMNKSEGWIDGIYGGRRAQDL